MAMKGKLRPIYHELQGYLSQAPADGAVVFDSSVWELINQTIGELKSITNENYDRYKIKELKTSQSGGQFMDSQAYRAKLAGLISRLHGQYFHDEPPPFTGMPSTVITQQQSQNQSTLIQILLDVRSKIDEKLREYTDESPQRTFLQKVKDPLSKVGNVIQLFSLIFNTAKEVGLSTEQLSKLFS